MTNFEVEIGNKIYKGECKDSKVAKQEYEEAKAAGHGAYLVEKGPSPNPSLSLLCLCLSRMFLSLPSWLWVTFFLNFPRTLFYLLELSFRELISCNQMCTHFFVLKVRTTMCTMCKWAISPLVSRVA